MDGNALTASIANGYQPPLSRPERLIASGRVVLAASSLVAVWLDPSEPVNQAPIAYALLAAYLGYSVAVAVAGLRWAGGATWRLLSHGFDLVFFSAFIYFTAGPASPFFAYFVFSLVCATLRWRWRGTLWTALAALVAYGVAGAYFWGVLDDPHFELGKFIIRGGYLAVVAVLLGYLGLHEERTRREISLLARQAAAAEERVRLARDLHDGVLQALTGIALRLEAVRRAEGSDAGGAEAAGERRPTAIEEVQRLIVQEQRDLRFYIRELRPDDAGRGGPGLEPRLGDLAERVRLEWGLEVEVELRGAAAGEGDVAPVPEPLAREVYLLVREALVNAARHGGARSARVRVHPHAAGVAVEVADDGRGFPFAGRYEAPALAAMEAGPRSLRERVEAAGGRLVVESSPRGAHLAMELPWPA